MTIEMTTNETLWAFAGGLLIGLSATFLLLWNGQIAGISGIVAGLLQKVRGQYAWRMAFVAGLIFGGLLLSHLLPQAFLTQRNESLWRLAFGGLLVGYGSRLGEGCTSGHGVCGVARLSRRSVLATLIFMVVGFLTVFLMRRAGVFS
jgi:uncharacterized membrane protein YedE/YeeE